MLLKLDKNMRIEYNVRSWGTKTEFNSAGKPGITEAETPQKTSERRTLWA